MLGSRKEKFGLQKYCGFTGTYTLKVTDSVALFNL